MLRVFAVKFSWPHEVMAPGGAGLIRFKEERLTTDIVAGQAPLSFLFGIKLASEPAETPCAPAAPAKNPWSRLGYKVAPIDPLGRCWLHFPATVAHISRNKGHAWDCKIHRENCCLVSAYITCMSTLSKVIAYITGKVVVFVDVTAPLTNTNLSSPSAWLIATYNEVLQRRKK